MVIQIDVHLAGETWPAHHMHPTLSPCMVPDHTYLTRSMHSNLSRSPREVGPYTQKNPGIQKQTSSAVVLGYLILPPSW
jgi:hypothetical protein